MELKSFIENFASQFEETEPKEFIASTKFKQLDEWTSLTAISIIAMVDDEYNISITGADIRNSDTIEDLFELVKSKANV